MDLSIRDGIEPGNRAKEDAVAVAVDANLRGRPDVDEHIPYYRQYIDLVPEGDIVDILERQIGETERYVLGFSAEEGVWRPAPDEWNAIEVTGHLADAERIFMHRALVIARGDDTPWASFEPDLYVANGGFSERSIADVVAEFATVRAASLWTRRAPESFSMRSVRAFAYTAAGHELHHLASLRGQRTN
jgi:hypothetical protein